MPDPTTPPTPTAVPSPTPDSSPPSDAVVLYDFTTAETTGRWYIVNDGVMGGISQSEAAIGTNGAMVFTGTVSLENFGGFASIRSEPTQHGTDGTTALRLRVLGDGQTYRAQIRTDGRIDGVAYDAPFQTVAGQWVTVTLPFEAFTPQFRGRIMRDYGPLNPATLQSIGFIISDKQEGTFKLEVDWIAADR